MGEDAARVAWGATDADEDVGAAMGAPELSLVRALFRSRATASLLPVWLWLICVWWVGQLEGGVAAAIGVGGAGVWLSGAGAGSTAAVGAASQALSAR